eukprot:4616679-Prymnesium_polylepis.1
MSPRPPPPKHARIAPTLPPSPASPSPSVLAMRKRIGTFGTNPRFPDHLESYLHSPLHFHFQPQFQNV